MIGFSKGDGLQEDGEKEEGGGGSIRKELL